MRRSQESRIIAGVLCCYPSRWRLRHGEEATELATALLDDGTPWWSIAGSFLAAAARERATRTPGVRVGSALAAIILAVTGLPLVLFASLTPASASGTNVTIVITKSGDAVRQLESAFAAHHFKIAVVEKPVSRGVGSILSIRTVDVSGNDGGTIREIHGQCRGAGSGCVVGLVVPLRYSASARVTVGVATTSYDEHHTNLARARIR